MKVINRMVAALLLVTAASCEQELDEINKNPDTLPSATDTQILTSAQGYLGFTVEGLNLNSYLWAQYFTWGAGVQIGDNEKYISVPADFNAYWQNAYANILTDLKFLSKSNSLAYKSVAKVLEAYVYQGLVDHFGDIPFSEAVLGDEGVFTPHYDDAATVYSALVVKLDEAVAGLEEAQGDDIADNDLLYGGDLQNWIRFANSLKLRILMRTSETASQQAAIEELISSGSFIENASQMPQVPFSSESGNQNPIYLRLEYTVGFFYVASNATMDVLDNLGDPRASAFYSPATTGAKAGQIFGIDQGTIVNEPPQNSITMYSIASPKSYAIDSDVLLMSPWEVWFLRAEAAARYGTSDNEVTAFSNAIQANFDYLGVAGGPAYIASLNYNSGNALDVKLDAIATQKWISFNGTQEDEGWIETRRFDRPASRLFSNGIFQTPEESVLPDGTFPSAWLIPATEKSLNPNSPAQHLITDKLFWDN